MIDHAPAEIAKDLSKKLAGARECHVRVVIVNMRIEKYKDGIMEGARVLARDSDKSSDRVAAISEGVLKDFKCSGVTLFIESGVAEEEMLFGEALSSQCLRLLHLHHAF